MVDISVKCFPFAFAYSAIPVLTSVSERISTKIISQKFQGFWGKTFGDAAKYCWFHNDSINFRGKTSINSRGKLVFRFSNDVAKTCSYRSKLTMKIEIKYLVHFKAYFHIFSIFRTGCLSTFKNLIRFHPHKIQSTQDRI